MDADGQGQLHGRFACFWVDTIAQTCNKKRHADWAGALGRLGHVTNDDPYHVADTRRPTACGPGSTVRRIDVGNA